MANWIFLIPLFPLIGFLLNGSYALAKGKSDRIPTAVGICMPLLSFWVSVLAFMTLYQNPGSVLQTSPAAEWLSVFSVSYSFLVDPLTSVMLLVITGVGSLIHIYSIGYMKGDPGYSRYFSYLNLFLFFMLVLVLGDNLLVMFVGWEGVGLCSYLLIGFWFEDPHKAACGKKAFVVNRIGDFGFLLGIFLVLAALSSQSSHPVLNFSYLKENVSLLGGVLPFWIGLCFFIGATGKSAQIPLYVWLPDAMAGPTPVSALIHAATMVTAGVYMVARLFFLFSLSPALLELISVIGLTTALVAALIAITQYDIKKVLAYSTVSQLGFMFLALGVGVPQAAIFHVVTHAFFKACLFLGAGSVIHALHHEQDIRKMGGLAKKIPVTTLAFLASTLAIAGIPPFSGFFSKDEILWQTFQANPAFYGVAVFTAGLTAFYMVRLFVFVFLGKSRGHHEPHAVPLVMNIPVICLAGLAVVGGFLGVPEVLGGHNWFHHWLENLAPTHSGDPALELKLMIGSTIWAFGMSTLAFVLYSRNLEWKGWKLLANKFYVDEFYQRAIVEPIYWVSKNLLWKVTDEQLIDQGLVHGWSRLSLMGARTLSVLQTGLVGNYILYFWVAMLAVLCWI